MRTHLAVSFFVLAATVAVALAQGHRHGTKPYAGEQARAVSSLSAEELQGFLEGRGMGLAKPAEVNGYPGPMHVLELARELQLTPEQRHAVEQAFQRMKTKARELGGRYIEAERAVDAAFKAGAADGAAVAVRVAEANRLLGEVRLSHLAAHLEVAPLLTAEQRRRYAELRGYGGGQHERRH
jgi:Spy/CpxP family protein refolding chaperone